MKLLAFSGHFLDFHRDSGQIFPASGWDIPHQTELPRFHRSSLPEYDEFCHISVGKCDKTVFFM